MRVLFSAFIFLALVSCKQKLLEPPEDVISQETMTEILYDLALIKGLNATNGNILKNHNIETMPYIYEKYGIDSLQFVKSDLYYASVPEVYEQMYTTLHSRVEDKIKELDAARQQKTDSARAKSKKYKDSIKTSTKGASIKNASRLDI